MEFKKRKYKKAEVQKMLDALTTEYEEQISNFRSEVGILSEKNQRISGELALIKDKEKLIDKTLIDANCKAEQIIEKANTEYSSLVDNLKRFSEKWKKYFAMLSEKYPYYPAVVQAVQFKERLDLILKGKADNKSLCQLEKDIDKKLLEESSAFNPKKKIQDYIVATSDSGFNLEEVLNPGELHLEELCKELGLMDETNE